MFEINLVPDVKAEMIHAQRVRNFVFFLCFVVSAAAVGAIMFLIAIKAGQDIKMSTQDSAMKKMSEVLGEYDGLDELLTIQDQLNKLNEIGNNKKVLSRVFNVLGTILPSGENGGDRISVSKLDINLDESTLSFEAQAYAGEEPKNNFRVLDAFSKSIDLMRYDFGRYVDEEGREIPTRCIEETDGSGRILTDENGAIYAYWKKSTEGCDPSKVESEENAEQNNQDSQSSESNENSENDENGRVQIYRTPKIKEWYSTQSKTTGERLMDTKGNISGVPHFESQCIRYEGVETANGDPKWGSDNDCKLATEPGIEVSNSTDAVETGGDRVLRFNAVIYINEEVFKFTNKHMMAIAPSGKTNVTDSYVQIGDMFKEKAKDLEGEEQK